MKKNVLAIAAIILAVLIGIAFASGQEKTECDRRWESIGVWPAPVPCVLKPERSPGHPVQPDIAKGVPKVDAPHIGVTP
jgi:hypothetical protein